MLCERPDPPGVVSKSKIFFMELVVDIDTEDAMSADATPKTRAAAIVNAAARDSSGPWQPASSQEHEYIFSEVNCKRMTSVIYSWPKVVLLNIPLHDLSFLGSWCEAAALPLPASGIEYPQVPQSQNRPVLKVNNFAS
jgi:hypothetical protein